jgi:rubrerythrin
MSIGDKTKKNLLDAFAGESMARNKYNYFASVAKKEGYVQIANIFEESAANEKEHAKLWAKQLELIGNTAKNLEEAAAGEHHENTEMYPRMAKEAEEEGHHDIAQLFRKVGEAEKAHETRYRKLLANLKEGKVFARDEENIWKCNNCGYLHTGKAHQKSAPLASTPKIILRFSAKPTNPYDKLTRNIPMRYLRQHSRHPANWGRRTCLLRSAHAKTGREQR